MKFLKKNILAHFGTPKAINTDSGCHFSNRMFGALLNKYRVKHRVTTPYHPKANGQVEVLNREIKMIMAKTINRNRSDWITKLDVPYRHIVRPIKPPLECPLISWCLGKHVTYLSSWSIEPYGLSRSYISTLTKL